MKVIIIFFCIAFLTLACQQKERPDELEMITKDVLKAHRGIVIDIEPGEKEK